MLQIQTAPPMTLNEQELGVRHLGRTDDERGERSNDRDESRKDDSFYAVFLKELFAPFRRGSA